MFNYEDLCDVEFEALAQDVMSKKLGVELKRFAKGTDGGVDLTNNAQSRDIIVQVKHYYRSSISSLLSSLKKEIINVETNKPQKYYVVTSATLSADKKVEIFSMFRGYMHDANDVITREDFEDLLQQEDYFDVVKKHFKLWLHSTNILSLLFNADIEEDSLVCLTKIKENEKILVQTQAYFEAVKCLETSRILFVTGAPGVGKTITTQMLVLKYISEGYKLRFSTDTSDLNSLKKSLSQNHEVKEIILLDDCLGQCYFNMKSTQDSELVSLIRYVKISSNKILILNSRLTILNEAKSLSRELSRCFDTEELNIHVIDMNKMHILDKAKILYNHLYFSSLPIDYFQAVKNNCFYRTIINHKNYTPRIVEHITADRNYTLILPNAYPLYIESVLDFPNEIWDDEYSHRIQRVDRIFLGTLFSLTDTFVDAQLLENCFNYRLAQIAETDYTVNNFRNCLTRLNMSMIRVIDDRGKMKIGVLNPSVNDYLASRLNCNKPEKEAIINSIISVEQAEKMLKDKESYLKSKIIDGTILDYYFISQRHKEDFIIATICEHDICDCKYSDYMNDYFRNMRMLISSKGYQLASQIDILQGFLNTSLYDFYNVAEILKEQGLIAKILGSYELDELIEAVCILFEKFEATQDQTLMDILESSCKEPLQGAIDIYGYNIDVAEETEGYDIQQIIDSNSEEDEEYGRIFCDIDEAAADLRRLLERDISHKVKEKLTLLPFRIQLVIQNNWNITVYSSEIEGAIRAALEPNIDDYEEHAPSIDVMMEEIDYMFQR